MLDRLRHCGGEPRVRTRKNATPSSKLDAIGSAPVDQAVEHTRALRPDVGGLWSAWVEVNLDAVAANVETIRTTVGPACRVIAVVKADAYGHGAVAVAEVALEAGAQALGVALLEEALGLRHAGIVAPIQLLGAVPLKQIPLVVEADLVPSIGDEATANRLAAAAACVGRRLRVQVEIDTGLSRSGVPWERAWSLLQHVAGLPALVLEGVYTHFATAEQPDDPFAMEQLRRFLQATHSIGTLPHRCPVRHVAGSSAMLQWPECRLDAVRPGLLVLGVYPAAKLQRSITVTPVKKLWARIARRDTVAPGATVGYGRSFVACTERTVATVLMGFGGGYPRGLANRGVARVRDRLCPVIGSVALNHLSLDVSEIPGVEQGEAVELIGTKREAGNSIESLAEAAGVPVDVVCLAGRGLPHVYLRRGQPVRLRVDCGVASTAWPWNKQGEAES